MKFIVFLTVIIAIWVALASAETLAQCKDKCKDLLNNSAFYQSCLNVCDQRLG